MATTTCIRFDWVMKRFLRNKANFKILEGFLSTLLGEVIHIERLLESEGNKETEDDKFNRVDLLAENSRKELIIIEVQNTRELDYFHRMLYGTSKAISEYINSGDDYENVRKLYSINIVYFDLGQGTDYVYHGWTSFRGIHDNDELKLSLAQRKQFMVENAGSLFPEYFVLRVNDFDKIASTPLDEWISFLKTSEIPDSATASGLPEARLLWRRDQMSTEDRKEYDRHMEALRYQRSVIKTGIIEGRMEGVAEGIAEGMAQGIVEGKALGIAEGIAEGKAQGIAEGKAQGKAEGIAEGLKAGRQEVARNMKAAGISIDLIVQTTGLTPQDISEA